MAWLREFTEVWVPIFVAMSPLTVLPVFLGMTEGMEKSQLRQLVRRAVATGFVVATVLVLLGQALFRFLRITVDDLRVAGGIILLLIAIYDLIYTRERRKASELDSDAGVVPLGTPLIVGPATMTTAVVLADSHGKLIVIAALATNLVLTGFILHFADSLKAVVNPSISRAFGKVMSLFLAAIAVAMLRTGILAFIELPRDTLHYPVPDHDLEPAPPALGEWENTAKPKSVVSVVGRSQASGLAVIGAVPSPERASC